jgi:hypothetical protein
MAENDFLFLIQQKKQFLRSSLGEEVSSANRKEE